MYTTNRSFVYVNGQKIIVHPKYENVSEEKELNKLIAGCIKNDRLCQEKLYKMFYPALFYLCRKFFVDDHQALEILNDGMLKVFKSLVNFNDKEGKLFNWIYTIVRNTALDKIRISQRPVHIEISNEQYSLPNDNPLCKLENKDIGKLLDCLPPSTRVICSLYYLEGYTINNISDTLKLSPGTVKWHLSESRKKLQPILKKYV